VKSWGQHPGKPQQSKEGRRRSPVYYNTSGTADRRRQPDARTDGGWTVPTASLTGSAFETRTDSSARDWAELEEETGDSTGSVSRGKEAGNMQATRESPPRNLFVTGMKPREKLNGTIAECWLGAEG
jgi:hypothetical protein